MANPMHRMGPALIYIVVLACRLGDATHPDDMTELAAPLWTPHCLTSGSFLPAHARRPTLPAPCCRVELHHSSQTRPFVYDNNAPWLAPAPERTRRALCYWCCPFSFVSRTLASRKQRDAKRRATQEYGAAT